LTCTELKTDASRFYFPSEDLNGQRLIDYMGANLRVNYVRAATGHDIVLTNSGPFDIPPRSRWSIYFNHMGMTMSGTAEITTLDDRELRAFMD